VKRDIFDILRRGCHQNITPELEVSWRYLSEVRSIRNIFRDHLKHDISEALSERQLFLELGWDIGSVAFPVDFRFKSVLHPNVMATKTMGAIQKEISGELSSDTRLCWEEHAQIEDLIVENERYSRDSKGAQV
jgi:hypothetical protein